MEAASEFNHQNAAMETASSSNKGNEDTANPAIPTNDDQKHIDYKWWIRVFIYIFLMLVGQTAATILGSLYYDKGGNSIWLATLVQSAGFPILIPIMIYFSRSKTAPCPSSTSPSFHYLALLYIAIGLLVTGNNMMYSYGLLYLPVSNYSLLCATQLAFNAVFSYFLNAQKFTILIFNSVVILIISALLLAVNSDSDGGTANVSKGKYVIGFLCTLGASAGYSLYLSANQIAFEKVIKSKSFITILNLQFYPNFVATIGCVVGLFASGQWGGLRAEMRNYEEGTASYVLTLVWIALAWAIAVTGILGLIFEVSSLFSNVISTLGLPLVPAFAVVFLHNTMNGVKVISLVLALWGFFSYIYQNYLDDVKGKRVKAILNYVPEAVVVEIC
ncbi:Purine permease 21-like protein [Drosera capensis]